MRGGMRNLQVNGGRLWASLMELAQIGATAKGGVCRLAASDLDGQARRLFMRWCEEAGCMVAVDQIGNIFARRAGRNPDLAPVMTGSHLDTQPTGGRFDGAYGVMAALEAVRTLNDLGYETESPVEIVAWTNEEGSRFSPAMVGSGVFAGVFDLAEGLARPDNLTGVTLGAELDRIGFAGPEPAGGRPVAGYFEAHIEQGPILEAAGLPIGVVTGAQGQRGYEVTVTGQEAHAGPTPMPRRRNALVGGARMIDAVNRIGHSHAPYACATVGFVQASPNSRNTIPGRVFFTVDFRHPEDAVLSQMDRDLRQACEGTALAIGLEVEVKEFWYFPPTPFRPDLVAAVQRSRGARPSARGHHQRRRARRRLHGARPPDRDGLCPVRRRHQPQRDRGRQARGPDRRLQRAAERGARPGERYRTISVHEHWDDNPRRIPQFAHRRPHRSSLMCDFVIIIVAEAASADPRVIPTNGYCFRFATLRRQPPLDPLSLLGIHRASVLSATIQPQASRRRQRHRPSLHRREPNEEKSSPFRHCSWCSARWKRSLVPARALASAPRCAISTALRRRYVAMRHQAEEAILKSRPAHAVGTSTSSKRCSIRATRRSRLSRRTDKPA